MIKLIKDIWRFLLTANFVEEMNGKSKIKVLFQSLFLDVLISIISGTIAVLALQYIDLNNISEVKGGIDIQRNIGVLFIMLLIGSVVEEMSYRSILKYSPLNIAFSIGGICYYVLSVLFNVEFYSFNKYLIFIVPLCLVLFAASLLLLKKRRNFAEIYYKKNFKGILYISILLFTYMHIGNYPLGVMTVVMSPIILLPQFFSSIIYSYIRLRLGFIYVVVLHLFSNLITQVALFIS